MRKAVRKYEVTVLLILSREEVPRRMCKRSFLKFTTSPIPSQLWWCLLLTGSQLLAPKCKSFRGQSICILLPESTQSSHLENTPNTNALKNAF